jgi:hypothetical protein
VSELFGCSLGLFVILATFRWAFQSEADSSPSGPVPSSSIGSDSQRIAPAALPSSEASDFSRNGRQPDAPEIAIAAFPPVQVSQNAATDYAERGRNANGPIEVEAIGTVQDAGESIPARSQSTELTLSTESLEFVSIERRPVVEARASSFAAPRRHGPVWLGKGETIRVGTYTISSPLTYVCSGENDTEEASCIDLQLPVGLPVQEPRGSLGYYPTYARISRDQRANYLQWLSRDRAGPLEDIGYAFLYFYGLERRLLVEGQDLSPVVKEVVRLLEAYDFSGSFDGYLSRFLSYSLARSGIGTLKEKWFTAVFEKTRAQRDEQHLAVGLAWLFAQQRPLPVAWALRLARLDPRSPQSVVLKRLPEQFEALFGKRYAEQFGEGMHLRTAKRDREVVYRPASPSLLDESLVRKHIPPIRVPNVLGFQSQFAPLIDIWSSCIEELKPLSRMMAKGVEVTTRAAYEALPEELREDTEHPDKPLWEKLSSEHAEEDGTVLVPAGALARIQGLEERPKLTAKQCASLGVSADAIGFVIEPDARVTGRTYGWNDLIALFRPEDKPTLPSDGRYAGAALMLELGMFVAASDGTIEDEEVDHIATFLESQFLLDPPDVRRLEALKRVFLRQHPSLTGLGKRLKATLSPEQLGSIGEFLVGVAASNGSIDKNEISALRAAYRALEIGMDELNRKLEEARRLASEPVEVQAAAGSAHEGEVIPPRQAGRVGHSFRLDPALLERLMSETRQVATMLDEAMQDGDPEEGPEELDEIPPAPPPPPPADRDGRFEGLEGRHAALLAELCSRPSWPLVEFEATIRRHSLMPSGAMDKINEWAHDCFDDPILEEDGDLLIVHTGLLAERP